MTSYHDHGQTAGIVYASDITPIFFLAVDKKGMYPCGADPLQASRPPRESLVCAGLYSATSIAL